MILDKVIGLCYHCGNELSSSPIASADKLFCCTGCQTVYGILNQNGLCAYYDLNKTPGIRLDKSEYKYKYKFLDEKEFEHQLIQFIDDNQVHVSFYIPQIHCSSCLFLLEHLHTINAGISKCTVNFEKREVFIVYDSTKTSLRSVVETLDEIGYEPHLSLSEIELNQSSFDKSRLYKIGLAGFAFANIMAFSLIDYFSVLNKVEPLVKLSIQWISIGIAIPVILYSASEFFSNSWKALRKAHIIIDLPIAISLLITFSLSVYLILTHSGSGYLDSMTGIVFFMLIGRWFQSKTIAFQSFDRDFQSYLPISVEKIIGKESTSTDISKLKENDLIRIHSNEIIPVDCLLSKGTAQIDYSFVNGETFPKNVEIGKIIYAGAKQIGPAIELLVIKPLSQTYLNHLWNKSKVKREAQTDVLVYDRLAAYFGLIVLFLGLSSFGYWWFHGDHTKMWNALITVFIIACPCALLLAKTYTYGFYLQYFNHNKIYLRSAELCSSFRKIRHIIFDKTGTITEAKKQLVTYHGIPLSEKEISWITSLAQCSSHPFSKAILQYFGTNEKIEINDFLDHQGKGIEAWIEDHHIKLGSPSFTGAKSLSASGSKVVVKIDSKILGEFVIQNKYKSGMKTMLQSLNNRFPISVISGDQDQELVRLKKILHPGSAILFNQSPEDKRKYIENIQNKSGICLMIGDGLNDAVALKEAGLSISVQNAHNSFTPSADIIIESEQLKNLPNIISFARDAGRIIRVIFIFSIIYNLVGLYFAMRGELAPLIAAILMPLSSMTILGLAYVLSAISANKNKLKR